MATHTRDSTGRYIVRIPLKQPRSTLGNSYRTAYQCLQHTIRKLAKNHELHKLYTDFMKEYQQLSHMQRAPSALANSDSAHFYLPHHGVLRPDRATTTLRGVFNGSSSTSTGLSVNDIMHTGPNLLLDISAVLIGIRCHRHIFATDITKMYRQVQVHPDDWDLQRILWVDEHLNVVPYQLTTVTYGTKAAPFLAVRALIQLARDEGGKYPLAVPPIMHGRYVDDIFGGADTTSQLIEIAHQLSQLCKAGGFPLAKWHATHQDLLTAIAAPANSGSVISLDDCATKILGLNWLPLTDKLTFVSKFAAQPHKLTKRTILSEVAQIFDPIGLITPVTIRAKMLLQELWLHKLNWDETLPSGISSRWLNIRDDLKNLARLSIPRWLNTLTNSVVEIHGFSDASQLAMSAAVYIVVRSTATDTQATLICSKTKVAPLKRLTIPRLELTAALLLAKLIKFVHATLNVNISATHLWTDSQVTLTWIKAHPSRWKDFVRNRVTQIQDLTSSSQWGHVPGTQNPADCASRGVTTAQLQDHSLWWTGPPWITQPSDKWPVQSTELETLSAQESRPGISLFVAAQKNEYHWDLIYRYSSLKKLFRLTSLCFRILARLRKLPFSSPVTLILSDDMERARIFWIKATQAAFFSYELKQLNADAHLPTHHPFTRLTATIDHQGVIRVGGRLRESELPMETTRQAILPRNSQLTSLIIANAHDRTMHGGTQLTLAHIRQLYWIIGGRAPVKAHVLRCVVCARERGIRAHQLMGQLPRSRVTPSRAFTHTGVDYAGPVTLKKWEGRCNSFIKAWICVFVCFSTSAVHLEVVSDNSTDKFIAAYRRFISRRGIPAVLYSDCGTNFVGADAEIRRMFTQTSHENRQLTALLSYDTTTWKFNPPAAPHMGGKWEAAVKSMKHHLKRTVRDTALTMEELSTMLAQVEAILNSRPLEPLSDDPDDVTALTPGHFLTGAPLTMLPEPALTDLNTSRLSRWQFIQQRLQFFWSRWSSQYLQRLQSISKWHHPTHDIKVGTLVLITDERIAPCKWPLARVMELHPGSDGLTRVVTIKTATSTLVRPITKLSPLPINSG